MSYAFQAVDWHKITKLMEEGLPAAQVAIDSFLKENPMWRGSPAGLDSKSVAFSMWMIPQAYPMRKALGEQLAVIPEDDRDHVASLANAVFEAFSGVKGCSIFLNKGDDYEDGQKYRMNYRIKIPANQWFRYQKRQSV